MIVFTYDKTFEGLLCAIFDAYTLRLFPDQLIESNEIAPMMATHIHTVAAERAHFERVYKGLEKKLSASGFRQLKYAWLSEESGHDTAIFKYIRKVFDTRRSIENALADQDVLLIDKLAKKVSREAHLLLGFVRFQKTAQGNYAATISPRHNVLPLLLRHFASRFAEQTWLIYDMGRRYGVMHDSDGFHDVQLDAKRAETLLRNKGRLPESELDSDELLVQELWKTYFNSVAIQERVNSRQQARCMPRRFWAYLTEKQEHESATRHETT